ncbi:MAG TPA: hypothetical protein VK841_26820 [Polyangiaceae bacterium]|jgi:hypothetical protein|nr:hypothetical protein [Polyangiaceae bacterium]
MNRFSPFAPPFAPNPFAAPPPKPSTAVRFGTAVGVGTAAALVCALPATSRVAAAVESTEGLPRVWIALASAALLPMIAAVVVLRGAREGLRPYAGSDVGLRAFGVALWIASLLVAFALFGGVLRAATHQHALAGVTFAFGAAAVTVASAVACARVVVILQSASPFLRNALGGLLALVAIAALAFVAARFLGAIARDPQSAAAGGTVVDVLAFTAMALVAAHPSLTLQRAIAFVGAPIAVLVAVMGAVTLQDPPLHVAIDQRAPAFSATADLLASPDGPDAGR